jgi:hypothetical protein
MVRSFKSALGEFCMHRKKYSVFLALTFIFIFIVSFFYLRQNRPGPVNFHAFSFKKNGEVNAYIGMSLPSDFKIFSKTSPWNTPIQEKPEIDPFSDLMIFNLTHKAKTLQSSMTRWTIPLHVIDSRYSPRINVRSTYAYINPLVDPDGNGIAEGIPIPEGVWPDPGDDAHMLLVDPRAMKTWDFSYARKLPDGSWIASMIDIWDLKGPGFRKYKKGKRWWASGAHAAGVPLIAGLIRPEEIEAGVISHALAFASPINRYATFPGEKIQFCSPPASRSDGKYMGVEYIPLGARLQLDPGLNLDLLDLSPEVKIIATAMQKFGMYNVDGSAVFKIYFQNLGPDRGKWKLYDFRDLEKIPIDKFRVLKCDIVNRIE